MLTQFSIESSNTIAPVNAYDMKSSKFTVESSKETTARVVIFRELGITCSYTCEASFCGADTGPLCNLQFTGNHLAEMGTYFCRVLPAFQIVYDEAAAVTQIPEFRALIKRYPVLDGILSFITDNGIEVTGRTPKPARKKSVTLARRSRSELALDLGYEQDVTRRSWCAKRDVSIVYRQWQFGTVALREKES